VHSDMYLKHARFLAILCLCVLLQGCYFFDFFRKERSSDQDSSGGALEVLGDDLGEKAGGRDESALATVYAVQAVNAPASVRPDPDLFVRRLLRQFRAEGTTLARVIGDIENYRELLGGASLDFSTAPANGYDATSVLASMKVAEEVCEALVNPNSWAHPGWSTILPHPASSKRANLTYLYQRISGVTSQSISSALLDRLEAIVNGAASSATVANEHYVAPCAAIVVDAQAMLL
jgi:hypothetical protein